jgi:heat shock protein HslJ
MRVLLFIFAVIFCVGCANTADTVSDEVLDGEYQLTGLRGNSFSEEILFNFNPIGNIISGNTGCNQFSANFYQEGRDVNFTTPISTRKYCQGKMKTEQRILESFEEAKKFIRTGDEFVFYSEGNRPLITLTKSN